MLSKIFPAFVLLFAACSRPPVPLPAENTKPLVLVSIAPYKFIAEQITAGTLDIQTIIPPRSNPHAFEPTSRQILEISRGQVWFRIGEPFEEKILPLLLEGNPSLTVFDLRDGIDLQPSDEERFCSHCSSDRLDRHIWLSPKLSGLQAARISEVLSNRFPEQKETFESNLQNCLAELEWLDLEIRELLAPVQERSFIVSHSAFGYFCREYGLQQLSVEQEGKDPRPRHLEEMLAKARAAHTAIALALPQHNNKGAQIIAEEMKVPIRMIDPYSADYFTTLRNLARLIAEPHRETSTP